MKRRAFSLVEILVVLVIIGLITTALFPLFFFEARNLNRSIEFTKAGYNAQTFIEREIIDLNNRVGDKKESELTTVDWGDWSKFRIKLFAGREMNVVSRVVTTDEVDIDTGTKYKRNAFIILPQDRVIRPEVPEIKVELNESSGSKNYKAEVTYKSDADKDKVSFVVYRWYLGNSNLVNNGKIPPSDLFMIREYNTAKNSGRPRYLDKDTQFVVNDTLGEEIINGEKYQLIYKDPFAYLTGDVPLISPKAMADVKTGDEFSLDNINRENAHVNKFSDAEMELLYKNKSLVFSAMLVMKSGELGEEVYSEAEDLDYEGENYKLGISKNVETVGEMYKVRIFLSQMFNIEKRKKYNFVFTKAPYGQRLYLYPNAFDSHYDLSTTNHGTELEMDEDGYLFFDVMVPKTEKYGLVVRDGAEEVLFTLLTY